MNEHNNKADLVYPAELIAEDWEFKTIKIRYSGFREKAVLDRVLLEERAFGWLLVEKVDDCTIRVKRQYRFREYDSKVDSEIDPYRTYYRTWQDTLAKLALWIIVGTAILSWLVSLCY